MIVRKIYVAGPMRGIPRFNFPAFDAAAYWLRTKGWEVVSPAELDRAAGFDERDLPADYDWMDLAAIGFDLLAAARRDLAELLCCDAVYMLRDWQRSKGASAERSVAMWLGLEMHYEDAGELEAGHLTERS